MLALHSTVNRNQTSRRHRSSLGMKSELFFFFLEVRGVLGGRPGRL